MSQLPSSVRVDQIRLPPPGESIDILIGTTAFWTILVSHKKLTENVFLINTLLGSCLAGVNFPGKPIKEKVITRADNNYITTDQLDSLVRRYWEFEKLPEDTH